MEESHKDVPVARLPWIPINFSTKHMTDTSYYKEVMASSKNKSGAYNLELYRLLSDTMPFYLPRRYLFICFIIILIFVNNKRNYNSCKALAFINMCFLYI